MFQTLFRTLASLNITVTLFALSIFLVFAGTLAQVDQGIWTIVDNYFRSIITRIELKIFFPRAWDVPGAFYYPGGWAIGVGLFINLFAAHAIRFKVVAKGPKLIFGLIILGIGILMTSLVILGYFSKDVALSDDDAFWRVLWRLCKGGIAAMILHIGCVLLFKKRAGIVLLHSGIFLILLSELITGTTAVEANLVMAEGETVRFIDLSQKIELAIIDSSDAHTDSVTVVPQSHLNKDGNYIQHKELPFHIKIEKFMKNSSQPIELSSNAAHLNANNLATKGVGTKYTVIDQNEFSGVDPGSMKDTPSLYATFIDKESSEVIGTYLLSLWFYPNHTNRQLNFPQHIYIQDKTYDLMLRYKREYLRSSPTAEPFAMTLIDFKHDTYLGTNKASNFSSEIQLQDPDRQVNRKIKIWMNNPLRYAGLTFYQSSFLENDSGTVLQAVRNSGWMIPYVACMIVSVGLMAHFCSHLYNFLLKRSDK